MRILTGYAGPMTWGPDVEIISHLGAISITVEYEAVGDTLVLGRIKYYSGPNGGELKTEEFNGSISITTSNSVANVYCDFKGIVTGSTVNITVSP